MAKLRIGDEIPNFTFSTVYAHGKTVKDVIKDKATFFLVLRYIGCPVCRYDLHLLQSRYDEFTKKSAQVVIVMQSTSENIREDLKEARLPFDIICDPDRVIYDALEIEPAKDLNELAPPEALEALKSKAAKAAVLGFTHGKYEGIEEQLPALFLVDGKGIVRYAHYAKNIMGNPSIDEMLAMI